MEGISVTDNEKKHSKFSENSLGDEIKNLFGWIYMLTVLSIKNIFGNPSLADLGNELF